MKIPSVISAAVLMTAAFVVSTAMNPALAAGGKLTPLKTLEFAGYAAHLYTYDDRTADVKFAWSVSRVGRDGYVLGWYGPPGDLASSRGVDTVMVFVLNAPDPKDVSIKDVHNVVYVNVKKPAGGSSCADMRVIYKDGDFVNVSNKNLKTIVSALALEAMDIVKNLPGNGSIKFTDSVAFTGLSGCKKTGGGGDEGAGGDYSAKAEVMKARLLASNLKFHVMEYYNSTGKWPADNAAAGAKKPDELGDGKYVKRVVIQDGRITATFCTRNDSGCEADEHLRGHSLTLAPTVSTGGTGAFDCYVDDSSLYEYVPSECRHLLPRPHPAANAATGSAASGAGKLTAYKTVKFLGEPAYLYTYGAKSANKFVWSISREGNEGYLLGLWGSVGDFASQQSVSEGVIFMVTRKAGEKGKVDLNIQNAVYVEFDRSAHNTFCAQKTKYLYKDGQLASSNSDFKSTVTPMLIAALATAAEIEGNASRLQFTDPAPLLHFSYCKGAEPAGKPGASANDGYD